MTAERSTATTWCWRPEARRTSSAPRAPTTRIPCTRSTMRDGCGQDPRVVRGCRTRPVAGGQGGLTFVVVGAGATGTEVAGALGRPGPRGDAVAVPRPCTGARADHHRRRRQGSARPVLTEGSRLRLEGADRPRGRDPARHHGERDRRGPRRAVGRRHDPHALRHLGRRDRGRAARARRRAEAGPRWADRRAGRSDRRGPSAGLRRRRPREHPRSGRAGASLSWGRSRCRRATGRQNHPARRRRQADEAVRLSRQGDHGDDRPQRRRSPRWASTVTSCTARWGTPHGSASTPTSWVSRGSAGTRSSTGRGTSSARAGCSTRPTRPGCTGKGTTDA